MNAWPAPTIEAPTPARLTTGQVGKRAILVCILPMVWLVQYSLALPIIILWRLLRFTVEFIAFIVWFLLLGLGGLVWAVLAGWGGVIWSQQRRQHRETMNMMRSQQGLEPVKRKKIIWSLAWRRESLPWHPWGLGWW